MPSIDIRQRKVPKDQLISILRDTEVGWRESHVTPTSALDPKSGEVTLVYTANGFHRPFLMIVPTSDQRDILARISTFGADVAPLSQWMRVVTSDWARRLLNDSISPSFGNLAPAWVGAILGEVLIREPVELTEIPISWVHATYGYSVARFRALWGDIRSPHKIVDDIIAGRLLLRAESLRPPEGLAAIWFHLLDLQSGTGVSLVSPTSEQEIIRSALTEIQGSGTISEKSVELMAREAPDLRDLSVIETIGAEDRVRLFDRFVEVLREMTGRREAKGRELLRFAIGYLVGRIGAGETNLKLLNVISRNEPATMVWATTLPALFRPFPWGRAFDGLGRLILRDLLAPLHPTDIPVADISLDELRVIVNPQVDYKRLPFRTCQRAFALVELAPGVSHAMSLQGTIRHPRASNVSSSTQTPLLPNIENREFANTPGNGYDLQAFLADLQDVIQRGLDRVSGGQAPQGLKYPKKRATHQRRP
ncbi:MAG: hypothetical protein HYR63_04605 [Proteobacteria bacterium]|nr:hypothetical protein [Pseudomonadota bacterium]MBI3496681.1 hypothetical protein [Pseudomonadota bacterium]